MKIFVFLGLKQMLTDHSKHGTFWELLKTPESFWKPLRASGSILKHLEASGSIIWKGLGVPELSGSICKLLGAWEDSWNHIEVSPLRASGSIWEPLRASGIIWKVLGSKNIRFGPSVLRRPWKSLLLESVTDFLYFFYIFLRMSIAKSWFLEYFVECP